MDIKDKSRKLVTELFNDAALETRAENSGLDGVLIQKAVELLQEDGFEMIAADAVGPFRAVLLKNEQSGREAAILYPNGFAAVDAQGNEMFPVLLRDPENGAGKGEPEFLADYVAGKMWNDKTKSTGVKFLP